MEAKECVVQRVLKDALAESGMKQADLAERLGITQSSTSGNMSRPNMGVNVFLRMLEAMGYSVMVGKKSSEGFEPLWEVVTKKEEE